MSVALAGRTVLIADDHRIFAEGVSALLRNQQCHTIIVTQLDQIPVVLTTATPDLLVLDLAFGEESAMPLLRELRAEQRRLPILVISASEEAVIAERVRDTGAAFLPKSRAGADVAQVVVDLLSGRYQPPKTLIRRTGSKTSALIGGVMLSRAHIEVLRLVRDGRTNIEIAATIGRAIKTVESHVSELYARTGLTTRGHLIRWANDHARALHTPTDGT